MTHKTKTALALALSPLIIFILLIVAIYLPPVQRWAVDRLSHTLSENTGMKVEMESVRLGFPLRLNIQDLVVTKPASDSLPQHRDTLLTAHEAVADVRLLPLIRLKVEVEQLAVNHANVNTFDLVAQAKVKGRVETLSVASTDSEAEVDIKQSLARVGMVSLDGADLDVAIIDTTVIDTTESNAQWVIDIDRLSVTRSKVMVRLNADSTRIGLNLGSLRTDSAHLDLARAIYTVPRLSIASSQVGYDTWVHENLRPGVFSPDHISLSISGAQASDIQNTPQGTRLTISSLQATERSGLHISKLQSTVDLTGDRLAIDGSFAMPASRGIVKVNTALSAFTTDTLATTLDATLHTSDLLPLLRWQGLDARVISPSEVVNVKADATGLLNSLDIRKAELEVPGALHATATGSIHGIMAMLDDLYAPAFRTDLDINLQTYAPSFVQRMVEQQTGGLVSLPATKAQAHIQSEGARYATRLSLNTAGGSASADATLDLRRMAYDATLRLSRLPLGRFVKGYSLGSATGSLAIKGHGTDIMQPSTRIDLTALLGSVVYAGHDYGQTSADLTLHNGHMLGTIASTSQYLNGTIGLDAVLNSQRLDATISTDLKQADLYALGLSQAPLKLALGSDFVIGSDLDEHHALRGHASRLTLTDSTGTIHPEDITANVLTTPDTTYADIVCGDFLMHLNAPHGYKVLMATASRLTSLMDRQLEARTIDQTELRSALPTMQLTLRSQTNNPVAKIARYYDIDIKQVDARFNTSPATGINGHVGIGSLTTQGIRLDTIALRVRSSADPLSMTYEGEIVNVKPNDYVFHADFNGSLMEHGLSLFTSVRDKDNLLGVRLGLEATMEEAGIRFHLTPTTPILAYEPFSVSTDNYVLLGHQGRVSADVSMKSETGMQIQLYSSQADAATDQATDEAETSGLDHLLQDLTLSLGNINIGRLVASLPFAPRMTGTFNGDFHFIQQQDRSFSISSSIDTRSLTYEHSPIGDLGAELVYMPLASGAHHVDGIMTLAGEEIGTLNGAYDFDTDTVRATLALSRFPMSMVNGFVPDQIVGLEGYAEGTLDLTGTTTHPDLTGELYLSDASLISAPYGVRMHFDDDPVRIQHSRLLFENFQVYASNRQPLVATGWLDFSDTDHMQVNLRMQAQNFQLIDAEENRRSEAYGQAYVNFFAMATGELSKLRVRGGMDVLPTTNLYYILRDSPLTTDNQLKELVTFTTFDTDTALTAQRPVIEGMDISMNVNVRQGAHIKCWLNDARSNFLDLYGEGTLRLKYVGDDMNLTGRYTISEGELKYSLPIIPLKTFTIDNGSHIEFTGNVMNPRLNITARETRRATVSLNGSNQLVTFHTGVRLTKTLQDMGLEFIIESPENGDVADELNMKSTEERGKLAVTMLTTGMYLTDGNTSNFSMNDALNSFLQSEISAISGKALKTLDLSFGMNNSTEEDGTLHTNYNFKFAKRFWDNRLSISVGGKISTGPDVSGQNKTFFDNVEMQYRLSDESNKYMRLFYNQSVYDYLEGYVGQYGAGFMWKKKLSSLKEIFTGTQTMTMPRPNQPADSIRRDTIK